MIVLPSGAQVWLACGYTDMRNYVERRIMRSPADCPRPGLEFSGAAPRIILDDYLPLSMAKSLSGGRNRPALRLGAEVAFSASSFSVGSARR